MEHATNRLKKKFKKNFRKHLVVKNKSLTFAPAFQTKAHKEEFFERFKINKQVVQAGAPYVIYIWCTEKQEPSILILIDLESLSRLSTG